RSSSLWKFQVVEQFHAALGGAATARRVGARHNAAGSDRVVIEGANRSAVERSSRSDGFDDGHDSVRSQLVQDSEDEFAFNRESCHGLAVDDRFASLGVDDAWHDRRAMTHGAHNTAALPDVGSNCL